MKWSPQQVSALDAAGRWLERRQEPVFRLFGYAGTGKTTLAQELAASAQGTVLFAAFTGKAAYVMRSRGCPEATTIHRLIYKPSPKSTTYLQELQEQLDGLLAIIEPEEQENNVKVQQIRNLIREEAEQIKRPAFVLNPESPVHEASLVIIDECSMVDEAMGLDLLSFGKPILVLGDPAQLPPVFGAGFFTEGCRPDAMLTEIHRQAKDNPIIQMATAVRNGQRLDWGNYVRPIKEFNRDMARGVDQIIVGRNATRSQYNRNYRKYILGFTEELPAVGDKLVCLRNNHELGLLNGGQWWVDKVGYDTTKDKVELALTDQDGTGVEVLAHPGLFTGKALQWWERTEAEEFDYGYALTCHKSQGSQWDRVMVIDESYCFRDSADRWLYTAITRAAQKVLVLR